MRMWIDLPDRLFRARAHRRPASARSITQLAVAVAPVADPEAVASDRLHRELTAAALLVQRGVATRVLVANGPGTADLDAIRLLADAYDVVVEPVIRIGGGAFDFVIRASVAERG